MNGELQKQTVLVVDDTPDNITILSNILTDYTVKAATNGPKALDIAIAASPDIILLDIMMPGMDGYEVCSRLKNDLRTRDIPVIFVTAMDDVADEARGFELGAVDYITKPVSPPIVLARVKTQLQLYDQNRALDQKVRHQTRELNESNLELIRRLSIASEFRDNETGMHVVRISNYCRILAKAIGMDDSEADLLLQTSPMHDVGKIGIPDKILLKPGPLTDEEWAFMKKHTEFGAQIIGEHENRLLKTARVIALTHHERWDGAGYPNGLKGEEIPIEGRIVALADVFDALLSERPYKSAWPTDMAVAQIKQGSGGHFDPALVQAFLEHLDEILALAETHADEGQPLRAGATG